MQINQLIPSPKVTQKMEQSKKIGNKYNKVNQQKKFHLLTLIYKDKISIREASEIVGINFLTAKTIVFFHKNNYKSYQFDIVGNHHQLKSDHSVAASYVHAKRINNITDKLIKPKSRIYVICSIGNILSPAVGGGTEENFPRQSYALNQRATKEGNLSFSLNVNNHELPECKLSGQTNPNSPTVAGQSQKLQIVTMSIKGNERIGEDSCLANARHHQ